MKVRRIAIISASAAAFAIAALAAPTAHAATPAGGSSAEHSVDWLEEQGYHVQLNGGPSQGSLSQCKTLGVHGLRDSNVDDDGLPLDPSAHTTVYVDVACNDTV